MNSLLSSLALTALFNMSYIDWQLDFVSVMNVATSLINAFSCLLFLGKMDS